MKTDCIDSVSLAAASETYGLKDLTTKSWIEVIKRLERNGTEMELVCVTCCASWLATLIDELGCDNSIASTAVWAGQDVEEPAT